MYLYRIHIRPGGGSADMETTFAYCLSHGFLGVGWRVDNLPNTNIWEEYSVKASAAFDSFQGCTYIHRWIEPGDLVWTRDTSGRYYLARVTSRWEYWMCEEAIKSDIDIANVFRCEICSVEVDSVPGKVVASFRARRSIQEVASESALEYSKFLWNELAGKQIYEIEKGTFQDIFMLLDDRETEDLVFLFLQTQGWLVLPNSRQSDTIAFEYLLVKPASGEIAAVQVKTGNTRLDPDSYSQYGHRVFLFQANDNYGAGSNPNVICIFRNDLIDFLQRSQRWLPGNLRRKVALIHSLSQEVSRQVDHQLDIQ